MNLIPEDINLNGTAELNIKMDQASTMNLVTAAIVIITAFFVIKRFLNK